MRSWLRVALALALGIALGFLAGKSSVSGNQGKTALSQPAVTAASPPAPATALPRDPARVVYRVPVDDSPVRGPADALVTVVEFSDFQCPFCKRVTGTLRELDSAYGPKLRWVFKHNPLPIHDRAMAAASAAEQARSQGGDSKFWAMHDQLFDLAPTLGPESLEEAARKIGLDVPAFRSGLAVDAHEVRIRRDQALGNSLGARGTPTFFINGRMLVGAQQVAAFRAVIDEELVSAQARVAAGASPGALYAQLIEHGATAPVVEAAPPPPAPSNHVPVRSDDPVRGPRNAKVTLVLFSDFQCPFCGRLEPTLARLGELYGKDLRIVWKHHPLPSHASALPAALAAEAAREQGKFWQMHDGLFARQDQLGPLRFEALARELRLDPARFSRSLESRSGLGRIEEDSRLASSVGATGTPTAFVNCRRIVGAQPVEQFQALVDQERTHADAFLRAGAKLDPGFYEQLCEQNLAKPDVAAAAPVQVTVRPDDPVKGSLRAPVTIVAFSDFQCPFCARAEPTVAQVLETFGDKVRLVWKHQPLSIHPNAFPAALAAEAARQQGKFWQMHDRLFQNQAALGPEGYERWAAELGLDLPRFRRAMAEPATRVRVVEDAQLGGLLGANGTPTYFIDGEKLVGAVPFEQFRATIERHLARTARR